MTKSAPRRSATASSAIIHHIMVLELKVPHGPGLAALRPLLPVFGSYLLSFVFLGIYWNNHHHMLHAAERIDGKVLWANLHLLFWLSLVPFATAWMGEHGAAPLPVALYGVVLILAAVAYTVLQRTLISCRARTRGRRGGGRRPQGSCRCSHTPSPSRSPSSSAGVDRALRGGARLACAATAELESSTLQRGTTRRRVEIPSALRSSGYARAFARDTGM